MKKLLYVFSALALIFTSCSSDSDSSSNNPSNPVLPKRTVETYYLDGSVDEVVTSNFTFNGNKLVAIVYEGSIEKDVFTYTGDLITKIEHFENDVVVGMENFGYDAQGRLQFWEDYGGVALDQLYENDAFTYNSDGTILRNHYSDGALMSTHKFYLENGEVSKIESISQSTGEAEPGLTRIITYDDKNNAFKNILGYNKALNMVYFESAINDGFQKNLLTCISSGGAFNINWNFEYVYNSNNYPTSVMKNLNSSESQSVQFFYE